MRSAARARNWEDDLRAWGRPPPMTERQRCDNAVSAVRNAINRSAELSGIDVRVSAQGSYRNGTNVRDDSDVDVNVCCTSTFTTLLTDGLTDADLLLVDSNYSYADFKNAVEAALRSHFGSRAVQRGNKALDLHETTYHVDADVVPTFAHRRYYRNGSGFGYFEGTELRPDRGQRIINWPEQNYLNGVEKNKATGNRFKKIVRGLKAISNEMAGAGIEAARATPSFLIECLLWNVPNTCFGNDAFLSDLRLALVHIFEHTNVPTSCDEWGEINELKYLFRSAQPWSVTTARDFAVAVWNYMELG